MTACCSRGDAALQAGRGRADGHQIRTGDRDVVLLGLGGRERHRGSPPRAAGRPPRPARPGGRRWSASSCGRDGRVTADQAAYAGLVGGYLPFRRRERRRRTRAAAGHVPAQPGRFLVVPARAGCRCRRPRGSGAGPAAAPLPWVPAAAISARARPAPVSASAIPAATNTCQRNPVFRATKIPRYPIAVTRVQRHAKYSVPQDHDHGHHGQRGQAPSRPGPARSASPP